MIISYGEYLLQIVADFIADRRRLNSAMISGFCISGNKRETNTIIISQNKKAKHLLLRFCYNIF